MSEIDTLLQARATVASPAFSGTPTTPTPAVNDNSTKVANTSFVDTAIANAIAAAVPSVFGRTGAIVATSGDYSVAQVTGAAPLASPGFTGVPTAPTPATADNSTKVATTAFVKAQGYITSAPVVSFNGRTGAVVPASADYTAAQVTNAADKSSGATQAFAAAVNANNYLMGNAPQSANGTTSVTPIVDNEGSLYLTHTGGGTLTINNPGHFPTAGNATFFTLTVFSSAAGTTMAWGNAYKFGSGLIINNTLTAGQTQTWLFVLVGDTSQAICLLNTGTF